MIKTKTSKKQRKTMERIAMINNDGAGVNLWYEIIATTWNNGKTLKNKSKGRF